jgi:hypothetical protein
MCHVSDQQSVDLFIDSGKDLRKLTLSIPHNWLLLTLLTLLLLILNQFQQNDLCGVAMTWSEFMHSGVPTRTVGITWGDIIKELLDHFGASHAGARQAAGMDFGGLVGILTSLCQRDKTFRLAANRFGFGARGLDALMLKKLVDKGLAQSSPLAFFST